MNTTDQRDQRLHALDALRAIALLLGVAFHAALSFMPEWPPGIWAMNDSSPSAFLSDAAFVMHVFRLSLFFFIAGFFARRLHTMLGTRAFCSNRLKRIFVPLMGGWIVLFPAIAYIWMRGLTKVSEGAPPALPEMAQVPGAFPLMHLWFLYQLLWLYAAALVLRAIVDCLDPAQTLRRIVDTLVTSSLRVPVVVLTLGIPLAFSLIGMPVWFYWQGIPTPDQSLIPQLPASVGFGTAFAFGWVVQRSPDALSTIARRWPLHLALGMAATAWLLHVVHTEPMAQPGMTKNAFGCLFGVAVWGWVLGLTGAALRFLSDYSASRRYVADASYWIYLVHLPVVAALQVWVGHWPLHWSVKYPFILVMCFAMSFASYHFLVRSTFIGQLLNGRRRPRGNEPPAPFTPPPAAPPPRGRFSNDQPVAELRGVTKQFGATTALAGVDIEVRSGQLLAVLGPNGAGKSTAIALWLGLIEPDSGDVRLLGGSPQDLDRRRQLGVMMQDVELVKELRVRELIALAASYYPNPIGIEQALAFSGTAPIADRMYGKLSGGQKRQVQFAVAICGRPKVLFLDEPTVGLDVKAREAVWSNIRSLLAQGCSVVLTTHYLEEAEALATRVAVLAKGRLIACGSVDEMRALVARRLISCESALAPEEVCGWPGVAEVTRERGKLVIIATDAEGVVRRLLGTDAGVRRLEVREAGLLEAFNDLTREAA